MNPSGRAVGIVCGKTFSKQSPNGKLVFKFSLGCYDPYKRKNNFFNCTAFGKTAEIIERNYVDKAHVVVDYDLAVDEWDDKDGNHRQRVGMIVKSVDMIEWRIKKKLGGYEPEEPGEPTRDAGGQEAEPDLDDDDLPF